MSDVAFFKVKSLDNAKQANALIAHNERVTLADHVLKDLDVKAHDLPPNWGEKITSPDELLAEVKKAESDRGRKFSKLTKPLREAIILTKPEHTKDQINDCLMQLRDKLNIRPLWVHQHNDEGYVRGGELVSHNTHLHLGFTMFDQEQKKFHHLDKTKLKEAQKIIAATLGLQVGDKSKKAPLTHQQYRRMMQEREGLERVIDKLKKQEVFPVEKDLQNAPASQGRSREAVAEPPLTSVSERSDTVNQQGTTSLFDEFNDLTERLDQLQTRALNEANKLELTANKIESEIKIYQREELTLTRDMDTHNATLNEAVRLDSEVSTIKQQAKTAEREVLGLQEYQNELGVFQRKQKQLVKQQLEKLQPEAKNKASALVDKRILLEKKQSWLRQDEPQQKQRIKRLDQLKKLLAPLLKRLEQLKTRFKRLQPILSLNTHILSHKKETTTQRAPMRSYGRSQGGMER